MEHLATLELPQLIALLERYIVSPLGKWRLEEFARQPVLASRDAAEESLAETAEALGWLRQAEKAGSGHQPAPAPSFSGLRDVRPALERLRLEGSVLEALDIYNLLGLLDRAGETHQRLGSCGDHYPRLTTWREALDGFRPIVKELSGKILPDGGVADKASPGLARIRRQIEQNRQLVHKSLERFLRTHGQEGILQEDYVTIRNGRLVVPVKATWKWRIEGVIHGASSSGQTVFIEPLTTIELNNRHVRMLEDEQREIQRILGEMTERLRQRVNDVTAAVGALAHLELLFAKARFGREFECIIPSFSSTPPVRLRLKRARHPLLEDVLRSEDQAVVPMSLTLDEKRRVLVISGPNAGGKTIALKVVGLLVVMAQSGLPVPADEAEFPWFEQVLADIGDSQSIKESLSTFSAHINQLKHMMERATSRSLVLIDEIAAATDPEEGGALGIAVLGHFQTRGSFCLATTHLPALKAFAATGEGVENAAVGFDQETLSPNYRLTMGVPGQSAGLAMAQRLGIPESIIERARKAMDPRGEQTVAFLEQLRLQLARYESAEGDLRQTERSLREQESKVALEWERRETAKIRQLEQRVEELIARFEVQSKDALERLARSEAKRRLVSDAQVRGAKARRELRDDFRTAAQSMSQSTTESPPQPPAVEEGATVRLSELGAVGRVTRKLADGGFEVQAGSLKLRVAAADIAEVLPASHAAGRLPARVTVQHLPREPKELSEINVIGKTSEEAQEAVDKLLDDALLAEVTRVRVIHGHGMNVLRRALWQMFAGHPLVERYYQAEQHEGGAGATIVEVRA